MRKFHIFIIIFFIYPTFLSGQKYSTDHIIAVGDSILKCCIGDSLFVYAKYDNNTYYEFISIFRKTNWETLDRFKNTRGKFVSVNMRWFLVIPYPECPELDTIRGMTSFVLDSALKPTGKPYLDFIPDFFWLKGNCNIISMDKALIIAKEQNLQKGILPFEGNLDFDFKERKYYWRISNYLTKEKDFQNNDCGLVETVDIDAISGSVIQHFTGWYGPVY